MLGQWAATNLEYFLYIYYFKILGFSLFYNEELYEPTENDLSPSYCPLNLRDENYVLLLLFVSQNTRHRPRISKVAKMESGQV